MRSTAGGVLPRQSRVPPPGRRFNTAAPAYYQLIPPPRRALSTPRARTRAGFWRPVTARLEPGAKALIRDRATKTVSTTEPLKNGGFPIRDAFRRSGALSSPQPVQSTVSGLIRRPTSLPPLRVTASG